MPAGPVVGTIGLRWRLRRALLTQRRLHLGELAFQLGDTLLRVLCGHHQIVPRGGRWCRQLTDADPNRVRLYRSG
jgi:hypothetical protein